MTDPAAPALPATPGTPVNGVPHPAVNGVHPAVRPATVDLTKPPTSPPPAPAAGPVPDAAVPVPDAVPEPSSTPGTPVPDRAAREALWRRAGRAAYRAATDDRTRTAARYAARHGLYVVGGARIVARRTWDSRTAARYERMIRAAEAAGNAELAKEWEERCARFRAARHARRMELLNAPQRLAKAAAIGGGATLGALLVLGGVLAVAERDPTRVIAPTMAVVEAVAWAAWIASVVWGPLLLLAPWLGVLALWDIGRRQQTAPRWALPAAERGAEGPPITPSIVVTALRDLGITALRKAVAQMDDAGAAMLGPITIAGCGVELDVTLPSGVSTEEVMGRRRKLAENLGRHEHEVYVSVAPAARTVRMWIADSGALDVPVGTSPLITDTTMTADYKSGRAPWGLDLRGDQAALSLYQRHMLITGLSNQGKTASLRALALWLALDPTVEFRMADLKGVGDWAMFDGLAAVLIQGPTDDHVAAATEMVEGVFAEMNRRLTGTAPAGGWPPLVAIVDEAQVAYGSAAKDADGVPYGGQKANSRYLRAVKGVHDQGRAVNVTIWEGTQDPTNENLPKRSREGNHIRASLVLNTESQAAMALGESPVQAGAAPHKLRMGTDKGQLVVTGDGLQMATGQTFVNVRTYYIPDGEAEKITDRAKAIRDGAPATAEPADHLAAILAAIGGEQRMRTQEVLQRLAETNPRYRGWTFAMLKAQLEAAGAAPYKSGGVMVVARSAVVAAVEQRDAEDEGGDE
jgi:DNA segregation ATPase FtsK/SpoIIIE, S-DNA-T family